MSNNPFSKWTTEDATRHNERVARAIKARLATPGVPSDVPGPQNAPVASIEPKTGGKKRIKKHENTTGSQIQGAKPECDPSPALGQEAQGQARGDDRIILRYTGFRCRPLDPDNFAGGTKATTDCLRELGLLRGDEPWRIRLETEQVKVAHRVDERTEIEIIYPD
jgi:hypothetical protein